MSQEDVEGVYKRARQRAERVQAEPEDKSTRKMDLPDTYQWYHRRPPLAIMGPSKGKESSDGSVPELVYSTDGDSDDQGAGQASPLKR